MVRSVEKVRERLLRAASILEGAGVADAVTGDNAVAAWVSRVDESAVRTSRDVDLLLRRSDLDAAKTALIAAGFIHRKVASLGKAGSMEVFLDGPDAGIRDALHIVMAGENVHPDSLEPAPDVSDSEQADQFRLVSLEALVRMKLTAFRDKDRTLLRDLLELGLIDASWTERVPAPLAGRLQVLIDSPES
jgi:hypothetical protein